MRCRVCGCTADRACVLVDDEDGRVVSTCGWDHDDLCTGCAGIEVEGAHWVSPLGFARAVDSVSAGG